jgi:hypothetical protein
MFKDNYNKSILQLIDRINIIRIFNQLAVLCSGFKKLT